MENKIYLQCNKFFHLEESIVMYGIYNSDTLENLINTVHKMYNQTTWHENLFADKLHQWYNWYLTRDVINQYAINSHLYLRMLRESNMEKYMKNLSVN